MPIPYPFDKISKSLSLFCYFELYNLRKSEYEITYKLTKVKFNKNVTSFIKESQKPSTSISFSKKLLMEKSNELVLLDLSKITKGYYILEISVQDKKSEFYSTHTQRLLKISN